MAKKSRTPKRSSRSRKPSSPPATPPAPPAAPPLNDPKDERPEFYAFPITLMSCTPGNYDHADGERAIIVTVAKKDSIEPLVLNIRDTRKLVTGLLVSLATYEDQFAQKLLDGHFPDDGDGNFVWPDPSHNQS